MTLDVIKNSKIWFTVSGTLMVLSIVCIGSFGLNFGIDFTGGSILEVAFEEKVDIIDLRSEIENEGYIATVQEGEGTNMFMRFGLLTQEEHDEILGVLEAEFGAVDELRFEAVGPVIGEELRQSSVTALVVLLVLIVLYVAWAFRKVSKPVASWKYGMLTIVAALHDILIPIGAFAILGRYAGYQVDTAFVAALLTIMGYSINDTIVVFDRARENLIGNRYRDISFEKIVNNSVVQSFARSINTSLTTLLVLLAIFLFGGTTTRSFVLALIIGILSGAYSSLFLASPLLVWWEKKSRKKAS
jgi:preprotein translocase subunit SecF